MNLGSFEHAQNGVTHSAATTKRSSMALKFCQHSQFGAEIMCGIREASSSDMDESSSISGFESGLTILLGSAPTPNHGNWQFDSPEKGTLKAKL